MVPRPIWTLERPETYERARRRFPVPRRRRSEKPCRQPCDGNDDRPAFMHARERKHMIRSRPFDGQAAGSCRPRKAPACGPAKRAMRAMIACFTRPSGQLASSCDGVAPASSAAAPRAKSTGRRLSGIDQGKIPELRALIEVRHARATVIRSSVCASPLTAPAGAIRVGERGELARDRRGARQGRGTRRGSRGRRSRRLRSAHAHSERRFASRTAFSSQPAMRSRYAASPVASSGERSSGHAETMVW